MYEIEKEIKEPEFYKKKFPLNKELEEFVLNSRKEIKDILRSKSDKKILIVGPCSAWPSDAVIEYSKRIKEISERVNDKVLIILRVYTQKPRTKLGWTGPVKQPNPFEPADIEKGIIYCRDLMLKILEIGLPIADEALFTHLEGYFTDLLSWVAIGARSSEDQEHRIYSSMLDIPVGIKNPTSGSINIGINSIVASQNSHVFLFRNKQIKTYGNLYSHLILRGGSGKNNISKDNLLFATNLLLKEEIKNPAIIIDLSHENSIRNGKKDYKYQRDLLFEKLDEINSNSNLKKYIVGFMIESFLKNDSQNINEFNSIDEIDLKGLSITDPCIGIEETEEAILEFYNRI